MKKTELAENKPQRNVKYSPHQQLRLIELENQNMGLLEETLREFYDFRVNVVRNKAEYRKKGDSIFIEMKDYDLNCLLRFGKTVHPKLKKGDLESLLFSDFAKKYNPFLEYLDSLATWDEETDYLGELAKTVEAKEQDYWEMVFVKWFVGLVASMYDDKVTNQAAIILYGDQSIGKTTWLNKLVPPSLEAYKHNGMVNPKHRDTQVALAEKLLINLDEMEAFRVSELSAVKTMITMPSINVRRVYGHYTEHMPRRASFCGTTNDVSFLTDITGNRRFLPFEALKINFDHSVSLDGAYSQALHLYKNGFKYYFDSKDVDLLNKHNERFRSMLIEEEWIREMFAPTKDRLDADFVGSATDVAQYIAKENKLKHSRDMINRVGKILSKMGFEHFKKNGRKVYALNLLKEENTIELVPMSHEVELYQAG
jgi:predicted P-loop ATPase